MSAASAATLATTIDITLRGQVRATAILTALKGRLPATASRGLDRALAEIAAEQQGASDAIDAAAPGMPASVAEFLARVADRAGSEAAGMRESRPTPLTPTGGGAPETPSGPPAETPSGPPAETPSGPPAETPSGPPARNPAGS